MQAEIIVQLDYAALGPCAILMQIAADHGQGQSVVHADLRIPASIQRRDLRGEAGVGTRQWLDVESEFGVSYAARVTVDRPRPDWSGLSASPLRDLPPEVVTYLMSSRYCPADAFADFFVRTFDAQGGGPLIWQMSEWIRKAMTYDIAASNQQTTAIETFAHLKGVCRDYAHLLIAFARCNAIPARMVSAYGPEVQPQDFHAVVEVWLDGAWHLIDPTGMTTADRLIRIGVGRDAADIAFLTAFGQIEMRHQSVRVIPQ